MHICTRDAGEIQIDYTIVSLVSCTVEWSDVRVSEMIDSCLIGGELGDTGRPSRPVPGVWVCSTGPALRDLYVR